jgi:hypothetical protein
VSPVEADPTTPRKNRCTYFGEKRPLHQLSPIPPKVVAFGSVPPLPPDAPPSAATASASASASDAPPHVKTWKQLARLNIKPTSEAIELLSSPSSTDEEAPGRPCPATPSPSPGRPAGCSSLGQPAEIAEPNPIPEVPGDTGCTCDLDSERKRIQNRFDFKRRRYLNDRSEPELASYWTFLHATCPKGDPNVKRFKEEVSECRKGMFEESWYLRAVKTRGKLEQAGLKLAPLQEVIALHGYPAVLNALRHHRVPYVHRIPPPRQETKWPDNMSFVTDPMYWLDGWRDAPPFQNSTATVLELAQIQAWLYAYDPESRKHSLPAPDYICDRGSQAPTDNVVRANPATAATATKLEVPYSPHEDAYHPDYDDLNRRVERDIPSVIDLWTKARPKLLNAAKEYDNIATGWVTIHLEGRVHECDKMCEQLEDVKAKVRLHGKGCHSKAVLETCLVMCDAIHKEADKMDWAATGFPLLLDQS